MRRRRRRVDERAADALWISVGYAADLVRLSLTQVHRHIAAGELAVEWVAGGGRGVLGIVQRHELDRFAAWLVRRQARRPVTAPVLTEQRQGKLPLAPAVIVGVHKPQPWTQGRFRMAKASFGGERARDRDHVNPGVNLRGSRHVA